MNTDILVDLELKRPDWSKIREANGYASRVPIALRELLSAKSPEEVKKAYWKLENHVVVQGQLFEAAIFVVPVLMAALVSTERPIFVRIGLLELLFQILNGTPHQEEMARGMIDINERCKALAKEGLWLLYRELLTEVHDGARDVIEILDENKSRLSDMDQK